MSTGREAMTCGYCKRPIRFVSLSRQIKAGACKNPRCCYTDRVHIETSSEIRTVTVDLREK